MNIKSNLRKLNKLSKIIDLIDFYTIAIDDTDIRLQGTYTSNLVKKICNGFNDKFSIKIDIDTRFIKITYKNINITLT